MDKETKANVVDDKIISIKDIQTDISGAAKDVAVAIVPEKQENDTQQDTSVTDLVILQGDQVLTTSLKVAKVFGKQHKHVIEAIDNTVKILQEVNGPDFRPVEKGFILADYTDNKGEKRPMYYLNRDAFSFVVMGFTGKKAAEWKWRYIQAFNQMEEALKTQQKPLSTVDMFGLAYQALKEHEEKLLQHDQQISELLANQAALVTYNMRNVAGLKSVNKEQQRQLDKHEEDISSIKKVFNTDIGPREEIKTIVEIAVRVHNLTYQDAYNIVYAEIQKALGINLGTRVNNIKKRLQKSGANKTKIEAVTKLDAIEQDLSLYKPVREVLVSLREAAATVVEDNK